MGSQRIIDTNRIYPNREKALDEELVRLRDAPISDQNREVILLFLDHVGLSSGFLRKSKLSSQMRNICVALGKDLDKAEKSDIVRIVAQYNNHPTYSKETKRDYRRTIKQFYKWFKGEDPKLESGDLKELQQTTKFYSYLEKEVSTKCTGSQLDPSSLIMEEDIRQVVTKGCRNVKEKAIIMLLYETGTRAGEFLNIQLRDIKMQRNHAIITVAGKTGVRQIPIVQSLPYLGQWLEMHPFRDNPEAYLWITESRYCRHQPFKHQGAQKLINNCFARAGLEHRQHNLHWFRHSCASRLHRKMPPQTLHRYMGWSPTSKQLSNYVHVGDTDVQESVMEINGIVKVKEEKNGLEPKLCQFCEAVNKFDARYCCKCGNAVDSAVVMEDQDTLKTEMESRLKFLMQVMADPELKQKYELFKINHSKGI